MKLPILLLSLSPLVAWADTPQPPACNAESFFSSQFDYAVGRVVDAGQVLLLGEAQGCLDEERDGCRSGEEMEPGTGLVIGDSWNSYYCVKARSPSKEVVGWAPESRVMKTSNYVATSPTDWVAHWERSDGNAIDIAAKGDAFELSTREGGEGTAPRLLGRAAPEEGEDVLYLRQGRCTTRVLLRGTDLVVADNGQCGERERRLRGEYHNRAPLDRLMQRLGQ
ncbi:MAG TPA: hypothetical protein DIW85_16100 [Stenotrophomonas sp.]|nr:hypothetical protein [Stenotrophomonas sp.]